MQALIESLAPLRQYGAKLGPYVLLELLLPGGTLFALLLFLHQRLKASGGDLATRPALPPAVVSTDYVARLQNNPLTQTLRRWCAGACC